MKSSKNSTPIVGAWKLISYRVQKDSEEAIHPFGKNASGSLIYTDSGRVSAQIMRSDRPKLASEDPTKGTIDEIKANYEGYVSYYGSYEVDKKNGFVIHHVEGSLVPNWEGLKLKRFFKLSHNRLTLIPPPELLDGSRYVTTLTWERIS